MLGGRVQMKERGKAVTFGRMKGVLVFESRPSIGVIEKEGIFASVGKIASSVHIFLND